MFKAQPSVIHTHKRWAFPFQYLLLSPSIAVFVLASLSLFLTFSLLLLGLTEEEEVREKGESALATTLLCPRLWPQPASRRTTTKALMVVVVERTLSLLSPSYTHLPIGGTHGAAAAACRILLVLSN